MNKAELIEKIVSKVDAITKATAEHVLDAVIESIVETVSHGGEVSLVGFGTFKSSKRAARQGRNPKTNEAIQIPARKVPVFRVGKKFKEEVNR